MVEQVSLPPNQQLLAARQQKAWSLGFVAQQLSLPVETVAALEQGEYEKLHGSAFVVAYLRAYARLLELDAEQVINEYKISLDQQQRAQYENSLIVAASIKAQHKKYRTGYGVAAAIALVGCLAILSPDVSKEQNASAAIVVDTAVGTTLISSLEGLPEENPTEALVPEVVMVNQLVLGEGADASEQVISSSQLNFRFSADCWVEVVDGDNQQIFAAMQKTDQVLQLTGKPPFRITLGYAPGVELSYNGQPVDIDAAASETARLVLGNS